MRVLTIDEFLDNKIPSLEEFKLGRKVYVEKVIKPLVGNGVVSFLEYGSSLRNDFSVVSDIDNVIVYDEDGVKDRILLGTRKIYLEYNVAIETNPVSYENLINGEHTFDEPFMEHLVLAHENNSCLGENFFDLVEDNYNIPFESSLRRVLAGYKSKLDRMYTDFYKFNNRKEDLLRVILEKPVHTMRIAIQYRNGSFGFDRMNDFVDTKDNLMTVYSEMLDDVDAINDIRRIRNVSSKYVDLIHQRSNGAAPRENLINLYYDVLEDIIDCYSNACNFIDFNLKMMRK